MPTRDYNTSLQTNYSKTSTRDFLSSQSAHTSAFLQTKLARAAIALKKNTPMSWGEIAKELGLASGKAVTMLVNNWGKE